MDVQVDFATPADDEGIRALMRRQSLGGRIRLTMTRDPEFATGCSATGEECRTVVARAGADRAIVGVACRSVRRVFWNGQPRRIGYLSQLRVDERFRGRWLLSQGFRLLDRVHREDPVPAYLAAVVDGDGEAAGVLVSRRRRTFPVLQEIAACRTLAIPLRAAGRQSAEPLTIAAASAGELAELADFLQTQGARCQLFPVWTEERLRGLATLGLEPRDILLARRNGELVGSLALWDQSRFKQTAVAGYAGWWRALRPLLPPVGAVLRIVYASLICIAGEEPAVFQGLLREACHAARARSNDYLLIGLDVRDPLLRIARAYRHFSYSSRLYAGPWAGEPRREAFDARLARIDIATL